MQGIYLKDLGLNFVKTCFDLYYGNVYFFGLFLAGILLFFIHKKGEKNYISIYTIFLFLTIFNPILVNLVYSHFQMDDVYYRFFWLLPVNIIAAYLFTAFISAHSHIFKRIGAAIICICMVLLLGTPVIQPSALLKMPDNLYKVSDEILEISELVHQNSERDIPRIAPANELLMTLRQYDGSVQLSLHRDYVLCWQGSPGFQWAAAQNDYSYQKTLMEVLYAGDTSIPYDTFQTAIWATQTHYLVVSRHVPVHDYLIDFGAEYVAETDSYLIYQVQ